MTIINRQFRLAERPRGLPDAATWQQTTEPLRELRDGEVAVRTACISLDPAMRAWLDDVKSYIAPVGIGEVMRAGCAGHVIESRDPRFAVGAAVTGIWGVQEYAVHPAQDLTLVDERLAPLPVHLSALGFPGMTAYFGLLDIGKPAPGQTVVVSGAAGAVGSLVGQIARICGARAVGIAGGADKCRHLVEDLGFDAAIDYKAGDLRRDLKAHCPRGVDVYFDNVGGAILDAVLPRLALHARVVLCGAISQYNGEPHVGPANYLALMVQRASMTGMVVFDYVPRFPAGIRQMAAWLDDGRLRSREHIVDGFERFPQALPMLFTGANTGKLILRM